MKIPMLVVIDKGKATMPVSWLVLITTSGPNYACPPYIHTHTSVPKSRNDKVRNDSNGVLVVLSVFAFWCIMAGWDGKAYGRRVWSDLFFGTKENSWDTLFTVHFLGRGLCVCASVCDLRGK
jgi:hypothetical protein